MASLTSSLFILLFSLTILSGFSQDQINGGQSTSHQGGAYCRPIRDGVTCQDSTASKYRSVCFACFQHPTAEKLLSDVNSACGEGGADCHKFPAGIDCFDINVILSRLMEVVNQMKIYGEKFTDKDVVEKVLISLTERFDPKIATIEESRDLSKLTITELIGSLQAHEERLLERVDSGSEMAFQAKHKGKQMGKDNKKSSPDKNSKGKNAQSSRESDKRKPSLFPSIALLVF